MLGVSFQQGVGLPHALLAACCNTGLRQQARRLTRNPWPSWRAAWGCELAVWEEHLLHSPHGHDTSPVLVSPGIRDALQECVTGRARPHKGRTRLWPPSSSVACKVLWNSEVGLGVEMSATLQSPGDSQVSIHLAL